MKKLMMLLLAALVSTTIVFTGCGADEKTTQEETTETTVEETTSETTTAAAESGKNSGDFLNVDKLDEIDGRDTFKVKASKIVFRKDVKTSMVIGGTKDCCDITIQNNTNSEISEVSLYLVAYTKDNKLVKLDTGGIQMATWGNSDKYIKGFVTSDSTISPGESSTFSIDCNLSSGGVEVEGVRVVVGSYKIGDTEYENDICDEWVEYYQVGKTTVVK